MVPELSPRQFEKLMKTDPTFRPKTDQIGKYGKWIIESYLTWPDNMKRMAWSNPGLLAELKGVLKVFHKLREQNKLPVDKRDFRSTPMIEIIRWIHENGRELMKRNKSDAEAKKQDARIIYEDPEWVIVTPKTHQASVAWGRRTNWCTAVDSPLGEGKFCAETEGGPVVYIISRDDPNLKYAALPWKKQIVNAKQTHSYVSDELREILGEGPYSALVETFPEIGEVSEPYPLDPNEVNQSHYLSIFMKTPLFRG
jgi:hypothetical protein